ncbi:MAG: hypothetical protein ACI9BW_003753 [Gammaproteobacteria bacterium]
MFNNPPPRLRCPRRRLLKCTSARIERLLRANTLLIELPDEEVLRYLGANSPQPEPRLRLPTFKLLWAFATRGSIGFVELYLAGDWDSDALGDFRVFVFALANDEADAETSIGLTSHTGGLTAKLQHRRRGSISPKIAISVMISIVAGSTTR